EEARARGAEAGNGSGQIRNAQRDMVQAFAALGEKATHDGIEIGGLEKLDARSTEEQHSHIHVFVREGLAGDYLHTELVLVEGERGFDGLDGNAQMIESEFGEPGFLRTPPARKFADGIQQFGDALVLGGDGAQDRWLPSVGATRQAERDRNFAL